jgi:hypothetical protein
LMLARVYRGSGGACSVFSAMAGRRDSLQAAVP